jgi:hypothetical protein
MQDRQIATEVSSVLSLAGWKHGLIIATYMLDNRGGNIVVVNMA